ncbi:MAG: hypothetical protein ABIP41_09715, partial [Croceibacterium sp.]
MRRLTVALLAGAACLPLPATAQDASSLRAQIDAMQAQIARLSAQVAQLEAQQKTPAAVPVVVATPAPAPAGPPITVAWKGGPEFSGPGGFSFKPRGRLQLDSAVVTAPGTLAVGKSLGYATE